MSLMIITTKYISKLVTKPNRYSTKNMISAFIVEFRAKIIPKIDTINRKLVTDNFAHFIAELFGENLYSV